MCEISKLYMYLDVFVCFRCKLFYLQLSLNTVFCMVVVVGCFILFIYFVVVVVVLFVCFLLFFNTIYEY